VTPLRLELSGFTCFKERTLIDFSDLTLFAISGPTGSGKSTLLDALTYALYGQIARLGSKNLELISPGLAQMFVQFEFKNHQGIYRVTRTLDRKKTRNDAQTRIEKLGADATWKQLPESEKIKEANSRLEQLVGLDYEGFTRAILLPQGAFDEFLRGDPSQRRQLLVSLLNLDKVQRMQQEAGQRAKQAELQRDAIQSRLSEEYAGATPERKRDLKESLDTLLTEQTDLAKRCEELTKEAKELEVLKSFLDDQLKVQKTLAELKTREPDIQQSRERLEQARKVAFLLPQITQLESLSAKLQTLEKTVRSKQQEAETLKLSLDKSKTALMAMEQKHSERLPQIDEQLLKLSSFAPLLEQLRLRGGSLELASQGQGSYSEEAWENLQKNMTRLPALQQAEKNCSSLEQELKDALHKHDALSKTILSYEKQVQLLTEKGKEARAVSDAAKLAYEQAILHDQASVLREHLHDGDTCPVCEQQVEVVPIKRISNLNDLKQKRDVLDTQLSDLISQHAELRANLSTNKQRLTEQEIERELLQGKYDEAKRVLEQLLEHFSEFGSDAKTIFLALQDHKRLLLAALAASIFEQTGAMDVAETQKRLQQEKRELVEGLKMAETKFRQVERDSDRLHTELTGLILQFEQTQHEQQESQSVMQTSLAKAEFASLEAVKQAALETEDIKRLEALLGSYAAQKESAERREVELQAKLSGRALDEHHYVLIHEDLKQSQLRLDDLKDQIGRMKQQLSDIEIMLERASQLRKDSEAQSKIYDTYYQLAQDLRGNNFQDYLLNQMQSKLAARASHIIRDVSEQRYDLRLLDSEYQVFDAWTQESRSAKTLSGGETFIASLALALALSDLLAGNKALGALFLDEGFGTLDAETLELVADVLESLTHQGRMVGVITHVQSLSERLPARLLIHKSSQGSSISWDL
jgi:DNA repair protein SbcC/Rad50